MDHMLDAEKGKTMVSSKDISSALEFEFDRDEHEIIVLEDLVSLSQHERWVSSIRTRKTF